MTSALELATSSGAQPATAERPRGLLHYADWLHDEVLAFNLAAYPARRVDWVDPRWRWMFLESAARLGVDPMVWLYRATTGVVAHQGAIPVRLQAGGREFTTGWFVETMVLEKFRGKAVGAMVVQKALEELPLNLSLGQTAEMRAIQIALGWVEVGPFERRIYVLRPDRVLSGRIGGPGRRVAAAGLAGLQRLRGWRTWLRRRARLCVKEISRFDDRHDRLWRTVAGEFDCAVVRDASYLNWKYVEQPGQSFIRLEFRDSGEVVALAILMVRPADDSYAYARGFIVDLVVAPSRAAVVRAVLAASCSVLEAHGADLVEVDLIARALAPRLKEIGFTARPPERVLLVSTAGASAGVAGALRDRRSWFITLGDSDVDRPW
jgi:GNAT superfamily N-acetyltransferase